MEPLQLLTETLAATAEDDHPYRNDLAATRDLAGAAIALAEARLTTGGDLPPPLRAAAGELDDLVRKTPERMAEITAALWRFQQAVVTFIVLADDGSHSAALDLRGAAATATAACNEAEANAAEIHRLLQSAQLLVGQAADDKLAGHYGMRADEEARAANSWRRSTLAGFAGTLALSVVTVAFAIFGDRTLSQVLGTGALSLALGGLTGYLTTQAKLHRDRETTFRQAELKLTVVSPMLDSISTAARDDLQVEVVKLLFQTERPSSA